MFPILQIDKVKIMILLIISHISLLEAEFRADRLCIPRVFPLMHSSLKTNKTKYHQIQSNKQHLSPNIKNVNTHYRALGNQS